VNHDGLRPENTFFGADRCSIQQRQDRAIESDSNQCDNLRTIPADLALQQFPSFKIFFSTQVIDAGSGPRNEVGDAEVPHRKLVVAPVNLRDRFVELIRREVDHFQAGRPAGIVSKMNAITDTVLIEELYSASRAGVPIDLLVRGVCCLRPGVKGLSETIRVGSIVGRFLEHSRVYRFVNGGNEEIYLSSADLMSRNLDRRVEVMFPLEDHEIRNRVRREALELPFSDNVKMRWLRCDGSYVRRITGDEIPLDSQQRLIA